MANAALGTWRNPPLVYVVAELGISPYYSLVEKIPGLQDALRQAFPRTIESRDPFAEAGKGVTGATWQFLSDDLSFGVQMGARAISLHATSYANSTDFLVRWAELLDMLHNSGFDAYVERGGLRYIDLIIPSEGRVTSDYLVSGLQGFRPAGAENAASIWSTAARFANSQLNIRVFSPAPPGIFFPQDFNALPLQRPELVEKAETIVKNKGVIGFIDMDCQKQIGGVFDAGALVGSYREMQKMTSETFSGLLSDTAKQEWM